MYIGPEAGFPPVNHTKNWLADNRETPDKIESANKLRKPNFRRRHFEEQILSGQKFFEKIFFKYLTYNEILCIIYM